MGSAKKTRTLSALPLTNCATGSMFQENFHSGSIRMRADPSVNILKPWLKRDTLWVPGKGSCFSPAGLVLSHRRGARLISRSNQWRLLC